MQAVYRPIHILLLAAAASAAHGHGDGCLAGHHWSCPDYIAEIRLQVVAMAVLIAVGAFANWLRTRARRDSR